MPTAYKRDGIVGMWKRLNCGVSNDRAIIDLARRFNLLDEGTHAYLLKQVGEFSTDPEDLEAVFKLADLVIVENKRLAYWMGEEIPVDWNRYKRPWDYFLKLVTNAKAGQSVDHSDFEEDSQVNYHVKMKHRLVGLAAQRTD